MSTHLFGKPLQPIAKRIPWIYQKVEYIETDGNSFIRTGVIPNTNNIMVETDIEVRTSTTASKIVFSSFYSLTNYYSLFNMPAQWSAGQAGSYKQGGTFSPTVGTQYHIEFNNSNHDLVINGSIAVSSMNCISTYDITIAACNNASYRGQYRYFSFRITDTSTGEVLRDLVPCYRKSDSLAGMYDRITGNFYSNGGTGTISVGPKTYR